MIDPSPSIPAESTETGPPETPPKTAVSSAEASTLIGWAREALAKGTITPQQAEKQFDELGATPEQRAPDRSTEEAQQAELLYGPVGKPEAYRFEFYPPGDPTPISPEDKAVESLARRGLVAMGFPQPNGQSLLNTVTRARRGSIESRIAGVPGGIDR